MDRKECAWLAISIVMFVALVWAACRWVDENEKEDTPTLEQRVYMLERRSEYG